MDQGHESTREHLSTGAPSCPAELSITLWSSCLAPASWTTFSRCPPPMQSQASLQQPTINSTEQRYKELQRRASRPARRRPVVEDGCQAPQLGTLVPLEEARGRIRQPNIPAGSHPKRVIQWERLTQTSRHEEHRQSTWQQLEGSASPADVTA